jgi:hypothetical protein
MKGDAMQFKGANNSRIIRLAVWMIVAVSLVGCAGNRGAVLKASVQTRQDVFQEVQTPRSAPGKALLQIELPLKTFKARIVNTYVKHSDPPYTAVVNIDGQAAELIAEPVLEDLPGDFRDNPEAGTGWKYVFKKTLLLEPGSHRITIAVPLSGVVVEKELTLAAGENRIKFKPIYNASIVRYPNFPRFSQGIQDITVTLNSQAL